MGNIFLFVLFVKITILNYQDDYLNKSNKQTKINLTKFSKKVIILPQGEPQSLHGPQKLIKVDKWQKITTLIVLCVRFIASTNLPRKACDSVAAVISLLALILDKDIIYG